MKRLQDQTLYEILEVAPDAPTFRIEEAYARAKALYGPGSLATYTLMGPDEAEALIARIEEAARVLLDRDARARYDASLAEGSAPAPISSAPPAAPAVIGASRPIAPAPTLERLVFGDEDLDGDPEDLEADDGEVTGELAAAPEPEPVSAPEPEPEPVSVSVSVSVSAPAPEPVPVPVSVPAPEPMPEPVRVQVPEAVEPAPEPVAEPRPAAPDPIPTPIPLATPIPLSTRVPPVVEPVAPAARLLAAAVAAAGPADAVAPPRAPIPLVNEVRAPPPAPAQPPPPRETPVVVPDGAPWTGDVLRQIREARGLSLQTLADRTKVTRHHIENIEAELFERLPAPVYLRGILMSVARELRLDGQKVAKSYLERARRTPGADGGLPIPKR